MKKRTIAVALLATLSISFGILTGCGSNDSVSSESSSEATSSEQSNSEESSETSSIDLASLGERKKAEIPSEFIEDSLDIYSYKVPKNYTMSRETFDLKQYDIENGDFILIQIDSETDASEITEDSANEFFKGFANSFDDGNYKIISSLKEVSIGNRTFYKCVFVGVLNGRLVTISDYVTIIENNIVNVGSLSLSSNNLNYDKTLKKILKSIKTENEIEEEKTSSEKDTSSEESESDADYVWEGVYKVGSEIDAGEYKLFQSGTTQAYYCINSDSSGDFDSILKNNNFENSEYITVEDGQYLELTRCYMAKASTVPAYKPTDGIYEAGMYKVGYDIPAGEYKLTATSSSTMGYFARLDGSGANASIIANDNFSNNQYVTVYDGEYLELVRCTINTK